ncbi:AraC family transcriptional regulator [filamentous cyanobacterium CCP1]|nr:AraC family transcriptional regulator [filamentous cyanobacterium CCP2]PSB68255.1 AraC family transcriptional regulator [filamentous cyanobacterium CCP1]
MAIALQGQHAIHLSLSEYQALLQDTIERHSPTNQCEVTWAYPTALGQGQVCETKLREGLDLSVVDYQLCSDLTIDFPDQDHPVEYLFDLAEASPHSTQAIPYHLYGSGLSAAGHWVRSAKERSRWVSVHIEPTLFRSMIERDGAVPDALTHLMGDRHQPYYGRSGQSSPAMQATLQHILHCPYQGLTRKLFLESKVLELMALLIDEEIAIYQDKPYVPSLKPDDIDRLHWAKDILHHNLENPPSLIQLARQVGLNECTLKRGFRQVFQTTVFGYLRQCRMERAKTLLIQGQMNVREAAQAVGYASQSRFASAFREAFGVNPKAFLIQQRH